VRFAAGSRRSPVPGDTQSRTGGYAVRVRGDTQSGYEGIRSPVPGIHGRAFGQGTLASSAPPTTRLARAPSLIRSSPVRTRSRRLRSPQALDPLWCRESAQTGRPAARTGRRPTRWRPGPRFVPCAVGDLPHRASNGGVRLGRRPAEPGHVLPEVVIRQRRHVEGCRMRIPAER